MYHRLLALGARGRYVPDLVIYHHVPAARLTKRYFRTVVLLARRVARCDGQRQAGASHIPGRHSAILIGRGREERARSHAVVAAPDRKKRLPSGSSASWLAWIWPDSLWGKHVESGDHIARRARRVRQRSSAASTGSTRMNADTGSLHRPADLQQSGRPQRAIDECPSADRRPRRVRGDRRRQQLDGRHEPVSSTG